MEKVFIPEIAWMAFPKLTDHQITKHLIAKSPNHQIAKSPNSYDKVHEYNI